MVGGLCLVVVLIWRVECFLMKPLEDVVVRKRGAERYIRQRTRPRIQDALRVWRCGVCPRLKVYCGVLG